MHLTVLLLAVLPADHAARVAAFVPVEDTGVAVAVLLVDAIGAEVAVDLGAMQLSVSPDMCDAFSIPLWICICALLPYPFQTIRTVRFAARISPNVGYLQQHSNVGISTCQQHCSQVNTTQSPLHRRCTPE